MLIVKIKTIKYNQGTVEWLSECIEKGTVYFEEAITGSGNHGLMMKQIAGEHPRPRSMNIAIFDIAKNEYVPCIINIGESEENESVQNRENIFRLTVPAAIMVSKIAMAWCNQKNSDRAYEQLRNFQIIIK